MSGFHKAVRAYNPLKRIAGKKCKMCGKPATCAILTTTAGAACYEHAKQAEHMGYEVIYPENKVGEQ